MERGGGQPGSMTGRGLDPVLQGDGKDEGGLTWLQLSPTVGEGAPTQPCGGVGGMAQLYKGKGT